jgi:hypothetical protein
MRHLLINLALIFIVLAFVFYKLAEFLWNKIVIWSCLYAEDECVKLSNYQLDIFYIKRKLLS